MSDDRTIHERLVDVLGELPAIGKNRRNAQQGFNFRGVDDVLDHLNPLLAKHGVFFAPEVLEREASHRETRNGGVMWVTNLHVRYTFYGLKGDSITASGWGEGTDSGDKSTNKAMTGAMKYVLFQVFAIATTEMEDSDDTTPEPTQVPPKVSGPSAAATPHPGSGGPEATWSVTPNQLNKAKVRAQALVDAGVPLSDRRKEKLLPTLTPSLNEDEWNLWLDLLAELEKEQQT